MQDLLDALGLTDAADHLDRFVVVTVVDDRRDLFEVTFADGTVGWLPRSETPQVRPLHHNDRVLVAVTGEHGGRPVVSAIRPEIVAAALDGVVPELRDGTVRVMGVAREPGVRTKIAVAATVAGVDAVAAILGRASNRLKAAMVLLGGERVDVVAWHDNPAVYATNALGPVGATAAVVEEDGSVTVTVPDHLAPAALGGGALNVRLAVGLLGRRITIVPKG